MSRFSTVALCFVFALFFYSIPAQAATDSIQITSATVTCGMMYGSLGAAYSLNADYTANGQRIIDEYAVILPYGGRIDQYHYVNAGTTTLSSGASAYGGSWNGTGFGPPDYPYTVDLVLELYAATTIDYINGSNVINGPLLATSAASAVCTQAGPAQVNISQGTTSGGGGSGVPDVPDVPGHPFDPNDDRINPDPAAPVAIYCRAYGIDIYRIYPDSSGLLVVAATHAEIDSVGDTPATNALIDSYDNVRIYRLTSGQFQVNAGPDAEGKEYVFIWDHC